MLAWGRGRVDGIKPGGLVVGRPFGPRYVPPLLRGVEPLDAETCTPPCRGLHTGRQLRLSRGWAQPLYVEDYTFGGAPEEAPLEVPPPRRGLLPFRVPSELGGIPQELIEHGGELGVFEEETVVPIV